MQSLIVIIIVLNISDNSNYRCNKLSGITKCTRMFEENCKYLHVQKSLAIENCLRIFFNNPTNTLITICRSVIFEYGIICWKRCCYFEERFCHYRLFHLCGVIITTNEPFYIPTGVLLQVIIITD